MSAGQPTVGILGGGQLGAMLGDSLAAHGARVRCFDPDAHAPALARSLDATVAPWSDTAALARFAAGCDVVTCEREDVPPEALHEVARHALVRPDPRLVAIAGDRRVEKRRIAAAGLPLATWSAAASSRELAEATARVGLPAIVKTARGGYDGRGQWRIANQEDLARAAKSLGSRAAVVEEPLALDRELSCIVARKGSGECFAFPVVENLHRDHVLEASLLPARIAPALAQAARRIALRLAADLDAVGLLAVELFATRQTPRARAPHAALDGIHLLVNEIAPRPHNSGHVTRAALPSSQFDALARVLLDLPLVEPPPPDAAFCMANLLGSDLASGQLPAGLGEPRAELREIVVYGKRPAWPRRKMGHFTVSAATPEAALTRARALRMGS